MGDSETPWVIAEAVRTHGMSALRVGIVGLLGIAYVLSGGVLYSL